VDPLGLCERDPYDPYYDYECWALAQKISEVEGGGFQEYSRWDYQGLVDYYEARNLDALEALQEISSQYRGVAALIEAFENDKLPGTTAKERIDWIIDYTAVFGVASLPIIGVPTLYTGEEMFDATGLKSELSDEAEYRIWAPGKSSAQVGHFLTAVAYGRYANKGVVQEYWALSFVVGHELRTDGAGNLLGVPVQVLLGLTSPQRRAKFVTAAQWYLHPNVREPALEFVGAPAWYNQCTPMEGAPVVRKGNSMADLRLSALGWNLGQLVGTRVGNYADFTTRFTVAHWLRETLLE
jgi:hypothetical protein